MPLPYLYLREVCVKRIQYIFTILSLHLQCGNNFAFQEVFMKCHIFTNLVKLIYYFEIIDKELIVISGYAFMPLAFIMGVDWDECHMVGKLIGIKTVANEFIAYRQLGLLVEAQEISPRASLIATYALCGYSNPGSIGVQLATIGSLCPSRRDEVSSIIFRAFVAGSVACFLTACIAGALVE